MSELDVQTFVDLKQADVIKGILHLNYKMAFWFPYHVSSLWPMYDGNPSFGLVFVFNNLVLTFCGHGTGISILSHRF